MFDGSVTSPRVEVVLSTYAARQEWLVEQLDSLWAQEGIELSVVVRDDGSPDDTADRVEALLQGHPARLHRGENVGPGRSFLLGLALVDPAAEFVAFCDQDDVWLPGKLARACRALEGLPSPAMYSARVEIVDEHLRHRGLHQMHRRGHSFANALVQCAATGCTIVLERQAVELLQRRSPPGVVLHDAWTYLVVTGCGTSVYDPTPVVRYRQHASNVVGVASTWWGRWSGRARRQWVTGHERVHTRQAQELERMYSGDLRPQARTELREHLWAASAGWSTRLRYVLRSGPHRQDAASDLVYRILFVMGRV